MAQLVRYNVYENLYIYGHNIVNINNLPMWDLIKEHIKAFWTGAIAGGVPTAIYVLRIPSMPGAHWLGDILKGVQIAVFSAISGLLLTIVTDIYKHYLKNRLFGRINKITTFTKNIFIRTDKIIKYGKQQRKERKTKDGGRAA